MKILPRFVICYLGMGNGLTVLAEHTSREAALADLASRDFSNSSLAGDSFYIFDATKVSPAPDPKAAS